MEEGADSGSGSRSDCDSDSVASNYSFMHCEAIPRNHPTLEWGESSIRKLTQIEIEIEARCSTLHTRQLLSLPSLATRARARPIDSSGICVVLCPVGQGLSCVSDAWTHQDQEQGGMHRVYRYSNQQEWTEDCRAGTTSLGLS